MNAAVPYVIAGAVFYGLDRVLRIFKSRLCTATLTCHPELHMTQVYIPKLNSGWRAGQHVRLRVFSSGMGLYGWAEAHPYTIASASDGTVQEGLVLLCKNTGRWTRQLHRIAQENRRGVQGGSDVKVFVEGPYGASSHALFWSGPHSSHTAHPDCRWTRLYNPEQLLWRGLLRGRKRDFVRIVWSARVTGASQERPG